MLFGGLDYCGLKNRAGSNIVRFTAPLCGVIFGGFWAALGTRAAACGERERVWNELRVSAGRRLRPERFKEPHVAGECVF